MDKETREFLEKKFNAIDKRFNAVDEKFEENKQYVDQKFVENKEYVDQKFEENKEYVDQRFEENKQYSDQKFEENKRYFGVVGEGLRNEIRQVAEGHQILLDGHARIIERLEQMERELGSMIKFSYAELDQRIRILEDKFQGLNDRLEHLEALRN